MQDLKQGLMASLYHNLKIQEPERQHQLCPSESWCAYKRGCVVKEKPHHLESCFEELFLLSKTKDNQKYTAIHDESNSSCFKWKIRLDTACWKVFEGKFEKNVELEIQKKKDAIVN